MLTKTILTLGPAAMVGLLVGCAAMRTVPEPGSAARPRAGVASCASAIARAHAALAVPGDSAAAVAAAHAAYAAAIHEYHTCLAAESAP
jgi:hypothetical protein